MYSDRSVRCSPFPGTQRYSTLPEAVHILPPLAMALSLNPRGNSISVLNVHLPSLERESGKTIFNVVCKEGKIVAINEQTNHRTDGDKDSPSQVNNIVEGNVIDAKGRGILLPSFVKGYFQTV